MTNVVIRHAHTSDIKDILDIQSLCYPLELIESEKTFTTILEKARNACFVAESTCDEGRKIIGFLVAHPWNDIFNPPELNSMQPDEICQGLWGLRIYYIHDLSVNPEWQGKGIGSRLVQALLDRLDGNVDDVAPIVTLVSVRTSAGFWSRHGFKEVACNQCVLDSYHDTSAVYMLRQ